MLELKRDLAEKSKEILTLKIDNLNLKKQLKENAMEREHTREMREREREVEMKKTLMQQEIAENCGNELLESMNAGAHGVRSENEIEAKIESSKIESSILDNSENCSPIINSSSNTISEILKNFKSATAASKQQFEIEDEDEFDEDEELEEDDGGEEGNYMDFGMLQNLFAKQGQNLTQNGQNSSFAGSNGQMMTPTSLASTLGLTSPGNSPLLDPANINFGGFNINHPAFRFPRKRGRPKKFGSNEPLPPPKRRSRIHENQVQRVRRNLLKSEKRLQNALLWPYFADTWSVWDIFGRGLHFSFILNALHNKNTPTESARFATRC